MVVAVPEDFHIVLPILAKIFIADLPLNASVHFSGSFTSMVKRSLSRLILHVLSDLGRHITVYWCAIFMLYVEHHDVFSFCGSRPFTRFCL